VSDAEAVADPGGWFPAAFRTYTALQDGRTLAVMSLGADGTTVEAEVFPRNVDGRVSVGPYRFATPAEARAFLDESVEALIYLGCAIE
jgi:hypothetical protein